MLTLYSNMPYKHQCQIIHYRKASLVSTSVYPRLTPSYQLFYLHALARAGGVRKSAQESKFSKTPKENHRICIVSLVKCSTIFNK